MVLKDIFPEYKLKKYINKIKNILQKNGESDKEIFGEDFTRCETPRQIVSYPLLIRDFYIFSSRLVMHQ